MGFLKSLLSKNLADDDILRWVLDNKIKTETGQPFELDGDHYFLIDPLCDWSPLQCDLKAPQIGYTVMKMIKSFYAAGLASLAVGYTFPTREFASELVAEKMDKLIANNPTISNLVGKKNDVFQKDIGARSIQIRGTFGEREGIASTLDVLMHDEFDDSKTTVIETFESRLQKSLYKGRWLWSNPSAPETGVSKYWDISDQMHWFVTCSHCGHESYLDWFGGFTNQKKNHTIDREQKKYVCGECREELVDDDRRFGRWVAKHPERYKDGEGWRGRWYSLLMCGWVPASEIVDKWKNKTDEYFHIHVLGLPYLGRGNKLTQSLLFANLVDEDYYPGTNERVIIGIDTGLKLDYVIGTQNGLFAQGDCEAYKTLDDYMAQWPRAIAIIDAGGDLIGSREFQERWPGRVFLCYFSGDRKTDDLVVWGDKDVRIDRNRCIQLVVDEFTDQRIPLYGTENDWYDYALDWGNLSRKKVVDSVTGEAKGSKWVRNGRDHRALATTAWRVGLMRFSDSGAVIGVKQESTIPSGDTDRVDWSKLNTKKNDWRKLG